jgi:hypothetical protein
MGVLAGFAQSIPAEVSCELTRRWSGPQRRYTSPAVERRACAAAAAQRPHIMSPQPLEYRSSHAASGRVRCIHCSSDLTVEGTLLNAVKFRPNKLRKIFSWRSIIRTVDIAAIACTACGAVSLRVDPIAVVKMAGDPAETNPPST